MCHPLIRPDHHGRIAPAPTLEPERRTLSKLLTGRMAAGEMTSRAGITSENLAARVVKPR